MFEPKHEKRPILKVTAELQLKKKTKVSLHVCVDFAVNFEGIESLKDGVIIISTYNESVSLKLNISAESLILAIAQPMLRTSGHLLCEKHNHLCEVDWSGCLCEHALCLTIRDGLADGVESSDNVRGRQETVLVCVHDTESLLELLDLPLGKEGKNVGATLLGLPKIQTNSFGFFVNILEK